MDAYQVRQILALVVSLAAAFLAYRTAKSLKFERGAAARVSGMLNANDQSAFDRYGEKYIKTRPVSLADNLKMAQLGGKYAGWTVGGVIARSAVYGAAALAYLLIVRPAPLFWLILPLAVVYPLVRVRGAASDTRAEIQRLMPETATALAAEMSAGASPEQTLSRAAEIPGPLGKILKEALSESSRSGRPAFTTGTAEGVVLEVLGRYNLPVLLRFGVQLDQVAGKGVEGPRVMSEVARGFAREYRAHVQMAAASLDNQLLAPMTLFFFLPFIAAIMLPLLLSLFSAF
ncbi:type II secretion system (T2SS), protein F [Anaerolinea thermolimosa]|uniref:type II secretion system F family protein n=1 Tax=Anaerolinea thermolimosa TaxID=229919 RepID=UPI0007822968|nr:type II secretion system F family protein [Anaerolinea thermolimosa]GAP06154.1 type II secretion system (T2SS), protein F [Anaerolinea thermolimosa]